MLRKVFFAILFFTTISGFSQVVINEIDTDTPATDDKEFIELKSSTANFSLNGYVLVFYNGSPSSSTGNKSYYTIDLDGSFTDANGIFVVGNDLVSPVPSRSLPVSTIQNGQDAIALYLGNASDFPDQTPVTNANLVDAVVYSNGQPDAATLISVLGVAAQINESVNSLGTTQSIQRMPDGTYEVKLPTPRANNDGSGFQYNGVTISVPAGTYNEGDSFTVTFTTQVPVTSDISFSYSLDADTFDSGDYTGNLNAVIMAGNSTFSTLITLIDDITDDGDELAKITFGSLPSGFIRLNDKIEIRVIDNDYTTRPWGTPLNPTYGLVAPTSPEGYYSSLEGKAGAELKQAIQDIIANPAVVHGQNYGDMEFVLKEADQNPLNSNQVWLMYVETPRAKYRYQNSASNVGSWNREHIFPQSRGGFADATDSQSDGIDNWSFTGPDDIDRGHGDAHHIRSEDGPENTRRSNKDYGLDDYVGPLAGTAGSWHGDVARSLFYMACRYNPLSLANGNLPDTTLSQIGDLATLLTWNHSDPSDDFEMNRNNVVYTWQINRNPFIDYPDLADYIWGANTGEPWFAPLATTDFDSLKVGMWPNPATDKLTISGLKSGNLMLYSISGANLLEREISGTTDITFALAPGIYFVRISSNGKSAVRKLIVR